MEEIVESDKLDSIELQSAPRRLRLINVFIDLFAMMLLLYVLLFLMSVLGLGHIADMILELPDIVFGLVCYLIYYLPLETFTGRTLGKLITKTKVVSTESDSISFYHAAGRSFARVIPFEPLSIFRDSKDCWHDSLMKTKVVKC